MNMRQNEYLITIVVITEIRRDCRTETVLGTAYMVLGSSLVSNIGHVSIIAIGGVHMLDPAVGKSHSVGALLDVAGTIGFLIGVEAGLGVVISHGVGVGVASEGVTLWQESRGTKGSSCHQSQEKYYFEHVAHQDDWLSYPRYRI